MSHPTLLYSRKFFSTACALIGYFEVTWHLTMKLFPAKISERETLQSQSVTLHCYARMLTEDRRLLRLGKHWDSRQKKKTFSLGTSHLVFNVAFGISCGPAMLPQFPRGVRWKSITSWLINQPEGAKWIVFDVEIKDDFFFYVRVIPQHTRGI